MPSGDTKVARAGAMQGDQQTSQADDGAEPRPKRTKLGDQQTSQADDGAEPRPKRTKLGDQQTVQVAVHETSGIPQLNNTMQICALRKIAPEENTHGNSIVSVHRNQLLNKVAITCKLWHDQLVPEKGAPHASLARHVNVNALSIERKDVLLKSWWVKLRIVGVISPECMSAIIRACPLMQAIDAEATSAFNGDVMQNPLCSLRLSQLTTLNLDYCRCLTDASIRTIVLACPRLAYLCVTYCKLLTDDALLGLAKLEGTLQHLILSCCQNVTGKGVLAVTNAAPKLKCIDLSYCDHVDEFSIEALAKCKCLERIYPSVCTQVTDACIKKIAVGCPRVHRLYVAYCHRLTNATLETIVSAWPSVRELRIFGCSMTDYKVRNLPAYLSINTT